MTASAANVEVALTGAAYAGLAGQTPPAPTDSSTAWQPGWYDLGYIDSKGLAEAFADSTTDIVAWQNHLLVRKIISKSDTTYKFTMLETKSTTLQLYHKGSVITGTPGAYQMAVKNPGSDIRAFGFDVIDGTKHTRIYVPTGEVTERTTIDYAADKAIMYEVTITAYPDATGTVALKFSADVQWGLS